MAKAINKNLTKSDLSALTEWGISYRAGNGEVTAEVIGEYLLERGISRDTRTLFRYKEEIDTEFKKRLGENKYSLDGYIDWEQKNFFDEFVSPSHIPLLRSASFWYELRQSQYNKHQFPIMLTYRWAKWASYFLSAIPNVYDYATHRKIGITEVDVWAVGQTLASRDIMRAVGEDIEWADIEGWLSARPWERGTAEQGYLELIDKGKYISLKRLRSVVNPEKTTIERIGMPFLANAFMTILSALQLKDKEGFKDYDKCYLLPSQQVAI